MTLLVLDLQALRLAQRMGPPDCYEFGAVLTLTKELAGLG